MIFYCYLLRDVVMYFLSFVFCVVQYTHYYYYNTVTRDTRHTPGSGVQKPANIACS